MLQTMENISSNRLPVSRCSTFALGLSTFGAIRAQVLEITVPKFRYPWRWTIFALRISTLRVTKRQMLDVEQNDAFHSGVNFGAKSWSFRCRPVNFWDKRGQKSKDVEQKLLRYPWGWKSGSPVGIAAIAWQQLQRLHGKNAKKKSDWALAQES